MDYAIVAKACNSVIYEALVDGYISYYDEGENITKHISTEAKQTCSVCMMYTTHMATKQKDMYLLQTDWYSKVLSAVSLIDTAVLLQMVFDCDVATVSPDVIMYHFEFRQCMVPHLHNSKVVSDHINIIREIRESILNYGSGSMLKKYSNLLSRVRNSDSCASNTRKKMPNNNDGATMTKTLTCPNYSIGADKVLGQFSRSNCINVTSNMMNRDYMNLCLQHTSLVDRCSNDPSEDGADSIVKDDSLNDIRNKRRLYIFDKIYT